MSGAKIIKALEEAERGDFSRLTIAGHVWIRDGVDKAAAWDAVIIAREGERSRCAAIAEGIEGGFDHPIADAIRRRIAPTPSTH